MAFTDDSDTPCSPGPERIWTTTSIPSGAVPTITKLYETGTLKEPASSMLGSPSAELNERVGMHCGSIVDLAVDAIVGTANRSLLGGGGINGAIHRAAGPQLEKECRGLDGCPTGSAKATRGYNLPAKHVIHAVGPMYHDEPARRAAELLEGCYVTSLELAVELGCKTIAFTAISTGICGYPSPEAAGVAIGTVKRFLGSPGGSALEKVIFVVFVENDVDAYVDALPYFFLPVPESQQKAYTYSFPPAE